MYQSTVYQLRAVQEYAISDKFWTMAISYPLVLWASHWGCLIPSFNLKLTASGRQWSRSSWKFDSHINILFPRRRWISIFGHIAAAFACDRRTRLLSVVVFILNMCRPDIRQWPKNWIWKRYWLWHIMFMFVLLDVVCHFLYDTSRYWYYHNSKSQLLNTWVVK